jgi:hypothetical protein
LNLCPTHNILANKKLPIPDLYVPAPLKVADRPLDSQMQQRMTTREELGMAVPKPIKSSKCVVKLSKCP